MAMMTGEQLNEYIIERIRERLNTRNLYQVVLSEDGCEAVCRPAAAASVWNVVQDAIREVGWAVTDVR
jgi:hypothetical protein